MAESPEWVMKYFKFDHLPAGPLREMSAQFCQLANNLVNSAPRNPERSVALRKLLEAKDAAVRSVIPDE